MWADFLGTGRFINLHNMMTFEDAQATAQLHSIRSAKEYRVRYKEINAGISDKDPKLPSSPAVVYQGT